jgi:hypothetical protein
MLMEGVNPQLSRSVSSLSELLPKTGSQEKATDCGEAGWGAGLSVVLV